MPQSIERRARFDFIRYANLWEDADVLCSALEPAPGKRILSIASGGDNAFALLAEGAQVVAADISPAQLACVELKRAAFASLEYEEILSFVGITESTVRYSVYQSLKDQLSQSSRDFWDKNLPLVEKGVIHGGKFERYFQLFRTRILPLIHSRRTIKSLFTNRDTEQRITYYHSSWDTFRWRLLFRIFFSRFAMGKLGRDPEFFRYVEGRVSDKFLERTKYAFTTLDPMLNPYLQYILNGNYGPALARCYRKEIVVGIKKNLNNLLLCQGPIQDIASQYRQDGFDGFNLSDIFEYLSEDICENIYRTLLQTTRPKARFAYWNMLVPRQVPQSLEHRVTPLRDRADQLYQSDLAFFYSNFVIEEVN